MLFNSYEFILLFLPVTLFAYYAAILLGYQRLTIYVLTSSSLFFYGWWNPPYVILILVSIIFNYFFGLHLSKGDKLFGGNQKILLFCGIFYNLALIGYFKYSSFFVNTISGATGFDFQMGTIILPLGISFFTFQQIAFLIDAYRGETKAYSFSHYCLFVTFFPQLIAGPIVHHNDMMPQFEARKKNISWENISKGITIFFMGLFKKVIIADHMAVYASPIFDSAEANFTLTFFEAWKGVLAFSYQLYFDFSGYSDMAIGLGLLFGISLPINFNSPYKARNIIDFWRRWHITLTSFFNSYLYNVVAVPLTRYSLINRLSKLKIFFFTAFLPTMLTFCMVGLWHGAGWTFILFGAFHGLLLVANHGYRSIRKAFGLGKNSSHILTLIFYHILTYFFIVIGWMFFRSESFNGLLNLFEAISGGNGVVLPYNYLNYLNYLFGFGTFLADLGVRFVPYNIGIPYFGGIHEFKFIIILFLFTLCLPNTQQIMRYLNEGSNGKNELMISRKLYWKPSTFWAMVMVVVTLYAVLNLSNATEFLYYQF